MDNDNYNVNISGIAFEWDERKNRSNTQKHKVSFEKARTAFFDEHALLIYDPDHSVEEHRFILLGMGPGPRLLVVCRAYRESERIVRIISARAVSRNEQKKYWQRRGR
jgi:uncharacterized DUF497 family protein